MPYATIILFTCWFVMFSGVPKMILWFVNKYIHNGNRIRPFDCEKCLAFWISIIYFFHEGWLCIPIAGCVSLGAIMLSILINKLR